MKDKFGTVNCNIFFEVLSIILILISYILYVIQSFKNIQFTKEKASKEIISERILYKYFSEEIYSNVKLHPICKVYNYELNDTYDNVSYTKKLDIDVKLDTYFDCQGITKGLLNEAECQNKIVSNLTCCRSECCPRPKNDKNMKCNNYNFDLKKSFYDYTILTYNDEERYEDPKRRYCKYYNKYSNTTSILLNHIYFVEECYYDYEGILSSKEDSSISINAKENYIDCGEIDSMHNHLFIKNGECPINFVIRDGDRIYFDHLSSNNLSIIVRNILSEIPPDIHERKNKIIDEEIKNNITVKSYYKIISQNENYYKKQEPFFFINELTDIYNFYKDRVNPYQEIYWYTSNYIGFKSFDDFKDFNLIFGGKETTNYLNEITKNLGPSTISAVIGIILIFLCIVYLIYFFIFLKINFSLKNTFFVIKEIISLVSFIFLFIIFTINTQIKFKFIKINMDAHYQEIIDLYNERRKQKYFLGGIILLFISLIYEIYFISCAKTKENHKNNDKSSDSTACLDERRKNFEITHTEKIIEDLDINNNEKKVENVYNIRKVIIGDNVISERQKLEDKNTLKNNIISNNNRIKLRELNINKNKSNNI